MELSGAVVVVTGGASGIGAALVERFAREGAAGVAAFDLVGDNVVDVTDEAALAAAIDRVEAELGPIDLFCSNAGVAWPGGVELSTADWDRMWDVNLMAHVHAARVLVPRMCERGGGYFLITASAAGLLNQIGSAPYGVTKAAAVALAEWLAITHGADGLKVSALCPQAVDTPLLASDDGGVAGVDGVISAEEVADAVVAGIAAQQFLILPHPQVADYVRHKADDRDRWIRGMQRLHAQYGDRAL